MIRFVASDDSRFRPLTFGPGLNVVLADITEASTDQDSRNGTGKTSFLHLLHFLLGGSAPKSSLFRKPELTATSFALGLNLGGVGATVVRSGINANVHLYSERSDILNADEFPKLDQSGNPPEGWQKIRLAEWKQRLSRSFFGLDANLPKYSPSTRSLLSYLLRTVRSGGFSQPFKHHNLQQAWDVQVSLSFLLDLDWSIPAAFERVRDEQKEIATIRKAIKEANPDLDSAAALRTEVAVARQRAEKLRDQASRFTVVEQYGKFQREADDLTRRLRDLRNADAVDRDLQADFAAAQERETPPGAGELDRLWRQVNIVLPNHIYSAYEDIKTFHESVITNRQLYLSREVELAIERIAEREVERQRIESRRSELLQILASSGALEQFTALESEAARAESDVRDLQRRHELAAKLEGDRAKTDGYLRDLLLQLQGDHRDRRDRLEKAIVLFEQYSYELYGERRGSLIIRETLKGPEFDVDVAGKGSVGIDSMQILCFDLVLMTLMYSRQTGPRFLVHDSHLFDGVDERQVASALMLGAQLADRLDFQYIVTMNSDRVPAFPNGFDFDSYVNPVRLTDATDDGGLFGFRFD